MELGIGMFGDLALDQSTGKYRDAGTKIHEILDQVKLMDEVGIDVFAMGEHHPGLCRFFSGNGIGRGSRYYKKYKISKWGYCFEFFGTGKSL